MGYRGAALSFDGAGFQIQFPRRRRRGALARFDLGEAFGVGHLSILMRTAAASTSNAACTVSRSLASFSLFQERADSSIMVRMWRSSSLAAARSREMSQGTSARAWA